MIQLLCGGVRVRVCGGGVRVRTHMHVCVKESTLHHQCSEAPRVEMHFLLEQGNAKKKNTEQALTGLRTSTHPQLDHFHNGVS